MKKQLFAVAAMLTLFLIMTVVSASAQTAQLTVSVPFDFTVGKTLLPAGTYTIYRTSTNTADGFLMRDAEGRVAVIFNAHTTRTKKSAPEGRLEFRRYGDQYFLARFWAQGSESERELAQVSIEIKIAKGPTQNDVNPKVSITTQ